MIDPYLVENFTRRRPDERSTYWAMLDVNDAPKEAPAMHPDFLNGLHPQPRPRSRRPQWQPPRPRYNPVPQRQPGHAGRSRPTRPPGLPPTTGRSDHSRDHPARHENATRRNADLHELPPLR